jgi:hypothetical protein
VTSSHPCSGLGPGRCPSAAPPTRCRATTPPACPHRARTDGKWTCSWFIVLALRLVPSYSFHAWSQRHCPRLIVEEVDHRSVRGGGGLGFGMRQWEGEHVHAMPPSGERRVESVCVPLRAMLQATSGRTQQP